MRRYPLVFRIAVLAVALALPLWEVHCAWATPSPVGSEVEAGDHGPATACADCDQSASTGTDACCIGCAQSPVAQIPGVVSVVPPGNDPPPPAVVPPGPAWIADDFRVVGKVSFDRLKAPPEPSRYPYSPRSPPLPV